MRHFTGTIEWTHEDEKGESPLGYSATLELLIAYTWHRGEYPSCDSPGSPDEVVMSATCLKIIDDTGEHKCPEALSEDIGMWFAANFHESPRIYEECCADAYHEMNAYQENQWEWEKENRQ